MTPSLRHLPFQIIGILVPNYALKKILMKREKPDELDRRGRCGHGDPEIER